MYISRAQVLVIWVQCNLFVFDSETFAGSGKKKVCSLCQCHEKPNFGRSMIEGGDCIRYYHVFKISSSKPKKCRILYTCDLRFEKEIREESEATI